MRRYYEQVRKNGGFDMAATQISKGMIVNA